MSTPLGVIKEYFYSDIVQGCDYVQECPPDWWTGDWQICINGTRKRSVLCIFTPYSPNDANSSEIVLPDNVCNEYQRPHYFDVSCSHDALYSTTPDARISDKLDGIM